MLKTDQLPLYELTRGEIVESVHYGSIAVSDSQGRLVAWYGDPNTVTFLRSSAKPFQALPFVEARGPEKYDLSGEEIAILCASHSGTDDHVKILHNIQAKTGVKESELRCGVHPPFDEKTAIEMRKDCEPLTPNRHNCSGKHTGMVTYAKMQNWSKTGYIDPQNPVQENILKCFSEMSGVEIDTILTGIDGCSAPNFAIPLNNTALAYARLCDPNTFSESRAAACRTITSAMTQHAFMVGGPNRFDTQLMEATSGRIVSKEGAEGYQALGIMAEGLGENSPALGIALKISDGDLLNRARPAVTLEVLYQLNALTVDEKAKLESFGPSLILKNYRDKVVGTTRPSFKLHSIYSQ
jgi:L-asparaginase II